MSTPNAKYVFQQSDRPFAPLENKETAKLLDKW